MLLSLLFLHETYAYTILDRKTKAKRKETGNPHLRSALDTGKTPKTQLIMAVVRPTKMLFMSPIVFIISLYMAILYAYLYLCFTTFPRIFEGQYGFSRGASGLAYLGIGIGSFFGMFIAGALNDRIANSLAARNGGVSKPEHRFPLNIIGAVLVPAGLFWYGWSAENKTHWMVPIVGTGVMGAGIVVCFVC